MGVPVRVAHPDPETEAWLSFADRMVTMQTASVQPDLFEVAKPNPFAGAIGVLVDSLSNKFTARLVNLVDKGLDKLGALWSKVKPGKKAAVAAEGSE